ncbi:MAG TPA: hypothetical protein VG890_14355 [Puia sp.]|nr:hypothetical protein [Puia sp.]
MVHKIKLFACLLIFAAAIFWLDSCKKNIQDSSAKKAAGQDVPDWVLKKWAEEGSSVTYIINQKVPAVFIDSNGDELTVHKRNGTTVLSQDKTGVNTVPCDEEDDDFLDNTFTFMGTTVGYSCTAGYTMQVHYQLTTAFTPVTANPSNPSQLSRGRIRFLDPVTSAVVYTDNSITPITINLVGNDPLNSNKQIYDIMYTVAVSGSYMDPRQLDQHRPIIYTTCDQVITTPGAWQNGSPSDVQSPCGKIDNIHITPGSPGSKLVYFGGCDQNVSVTGVSCYPSGLLGSRPDVHDIEWRIPGDIHLGSWPMPLPSNLSLLTSTSYDQRVSFPGSCGTITYKRDRLLSIESFSYTFPVSGTYEIRYQNVKESSPWTFCSTVDCTSSDWVTQTITVP